ncbi:beta strand repeat-containing protein, partial [Dolichospermum sp. LEGE 00246]|uniref:beta strand repeat-containing protein n=1 Tax=Dolichospermum sp. LEGE 00246 TaxID=1828605 RepID=UPI0019D9A454|nr:hypothetical protein [Dolichospermum sp. LEGE 00246]
GSQTYNDNVTIANNPTLAGNGITFNETVDGNSNLTLNAGTGNLKLDGAVNLNSLTTTAANTNIANNITTAGNQRFTGAVNLTGNNAKTFNSTNNDISFSSTLNGTNTDFTLNAGTGNLTFGNTVAVKSLNTTAANINVPNNITTTDIQQFTGGVTLTGNNAKTFNSTNSNINFSSTLNGTDTDLTLNAGTGNLTFGNAVAVKSLNTTAANINVPNNITTTGIQQFTGGVTLTGNNAKTFNSTNNNINFSSTLNGTSAGNKNLTVDSGTGKVSFEGIVGGIAALGDLAVNSTGITKFGSTVTANSLTTNTGGTTEIGGDITTTGKQTYGDGVNVKNPAKLTTTNSEVAFNSTVDGNKNLTVDSGTGNVSFEGIVGGIAALGDLAVNSTGTTKFGNTVTAKSLTTNTGGTTEIGGDITTTGKQTYGDGVNVKNPAKLTTTNSE